MASPLGAMATSTRRGNFFKILDPAIGLRMMARAAANCIVLHPACDDLVEFYNLHRFFPDNLRKEVGRRIAAPPGKRG
jgi:hypothetical protein